MTRETSSVASAPAAMSVAHASGRRVILRDSGLGYASLAALTLLGMATKVLLARALSPVELGMLLSGQAIVALALTVAQLNLPDAVARFVGLYSDDMPRAKGVLRSALLTVSVSACVVAGVVMLGAWPISVGIYGERRLLGVLMVLAVGIPFAATANVLGAAYRGVGALWVKIVYLDLVPALWLVLALSVMVALHATSLWIAALIYLGATLVAVTCVSVWFGVGGRWRTVATGNPTGELLRYGVPLLGAWLVAWPLAAIPLLLGAFGSMQSVAFYGLALSLAALVYTGVGAAETAALPVWSRQIAAGAFHRLRADYAFTSRWCVALASVVFVVLFLTPELMVNLLYGPGYDATAPLVRVVAVMFLLNAATGPNESVLLALGETRWIFVSRLAVGGVVVVLGIPAILSFGLGGAVAVYVASSVTGIAMYSGYLLGRHRVHPVDRPYARTIAAIAVALAAAAVAQLLWGAESTIASAVATLTVYVGVFVAAMYAFRALTGEEWRSARRLLAEARNARG